jgi:inorganic pyrophosphatase
VSDPLESVSNDDSPTAVGRLDPDEWLGRRVHVVIDRPIGTVHPSGSFSYSQNYGFVPGFISPDGEELDAYVVGVEAPIDAFDGVVIGVVLRSDDVEDKLIVSNGDQWSVAALEAAIAFQERHFSSRVVASGDG